LKALVLRNILRQVLAVVTFLHSVLRASVDIGFFNIRQVGFVDLISFVRVHVFIIQFTAFLHGRIARQGSLHINLATSPRVFVNAPMTKILSVFTR
jgi:hypothetical protein